MASPMLSSWSNDKTNRDDIKKRDATKARRAKRKRRRS